MVHGLFWQLIWYSTLMCISFIHSQLQSLRRQMQHFIESKIHVDQNRLSQPFYITGVTIHRHSLLPLVISVSEIELLPSWIYIYSEVNYWATFSQAWRSLTNEFLLSLRLVRRELSTQLCAAMSTLELHRRGHRAASHVHRGLHATAVTPVSGEPTIIPAAMGHQQLAPAVKWSHDGPHTRLAG